MFVSAYIMWLANLSASFLTSSVCEKIFSCCSVCIVTQHLLHPLHFILRDQTTSENCCCFRLVLCGVTVGSSVTSTCRSVVSRPRVLAGKELRSLTSSTQKLKQSVLRYRPYSHFLTLNHKEKQTRWYSFQVAQTTSLQETGGVLVNLWKKPKCRIIQ